MAKKIGGFTARELQEQLDLLIKQGDEQAKISDSIEGYIEGVKKAKTIQATINKNKGHELELTEEITKANLAGDVAAGNASRHKLKLLKSQTKEMEDQLVILGKQLKEVNKMSMVASKVGAGMLKGFSGLPGMIKGLTNDIRGLDITKWDKSVKKAGLSMSMAGKESLSFQKNIADAALYTTDLGVGMEELGKMQSDYSSELGRTVQLSKDGLKGMAAMAAATGLGAEGSSKLAADFDNIGFSAERTTEFIEKTMSNSHSMGLNASKVVKNISGNMKMLNKYNFKGGAKGLAKMAETATRLGVDMSMVAGMADKLFDIEGAVDMSAQMQVMGGEWAKLADPFKLMYMARNDMEGLMESMGEAAKASAHFNAQTGEFEISALEMHKLRKIAEQTGVSYEDLAQAGKNAAKYSKIKNQISFRVPDKETKEFIANTAQLDKNGKATIMVKGNPKFIKDIDAVTMKGLVAQKASLAETAKASIGFDEAFTNTVNTFKVAMMPFITSLNEQLVPKLDGLVKKFRDGGWADKLGKFAEGIGKLVGVIGGFIIDNPIASALTAGAAMFTGFLMEKAGWILNGLSLATGFNMGASKLGGGGGMGQLGGKLLGQTKGAGMAANFKGAAGSNMVKLGGVVAGLTTAITTFNKNDEAGMGTGENVTKSATSGVGAGLGAWGGAAAGAAIGSVIPVVGTIIGGLIGGALGAWGGSEAGGAINNTWGQKVEDGVASPSKGPFTITDKYGAMGKTSEGDGLFASPNAGAKAGNNNSGVMKIEFGDIHVSFDDLKLTSPGSPGVSIAMIKDPHFQRAITKIVHTETAKVISGGKVKA